MTQRYYQNEATSDGLAFKFIPTKGAWRKHYRRLSEPQHPRVPVQGMWKY